MAGLFDRYEDLRNKVPGAIQALKYCFTHGVCISGACVGWFIDNFPELIVDEIYDDFGDSGRWSIGKAYILNIDGEYYRCWEEVGLTEMQENMWWDQTLEPVHQKEVTVTAWMTDEEEDSIYG